MRAHLSVLPRRAVVGLLAAGAGLALATAGANSAGAAPSAVTGAPAAADLTAAHAVADSSATHTALAGFFADAAARTAHTHPAAAARAAIAGRMAPRLTGATVPVYYLNPALVTAKPGTAPVAKFAYLATPAAASDGQSATVWTVKKGNAWTEVNIASGTDETGYATKAGAGAVVFREPQINAWYAMKGGRIVPLNDAATRAVGSAGTTMYTYGQKVHNRYADKQAGSQYARRHTLGGFDAAPAASHQQAPTGLLIGGAAALAVAGLAGGWALRRRHARA